MNSLDTQKGNRIVETSGWDAEENFFVEKTILQKNTNGTHKMELRARVRVGSLVFVRVSEETSMDRAVPVTYRVSTVCSDANYGTREVQVAVLRPRETATWSQFAFRETAVN